MKIELQPDEQLKITFSKVETGVCIIEYNHGNKPCITVQADMPMLKNNGREKTYVKLL
jgi:hypothetical protein